MRHPFNRGCRTVVQADLAQDHNKATTSLHDGSSPVESTCMNHLVQSPPVIALPRPQEDVGGRSRQVCPVGVGVLNALVLAVPFWWGVIALLT